MSAAPKLTPVGPHFDGRPMVRKAFERLDAEADGNAIAVRMYEDDDAHDPGGNTHETVCRVESGDAALDLRLAALFAAAPDMLAALREAYEALHDIINAAGGDEPYTREELEGEFSNIAGNAWAALAKAEGRQA